MLDFDILVLALLPTFLYFSLPFYGFLIQNSCQRKHFKEESKSFEGLVHHLAVADEYFVRSRKNLGTQTSSTIISEIILMLYI